MPRARALLAVSVLAAAFVVPLSLAGPAVADPPALGLDQGVDLLAVQASGASPAYLVAAGYLPNSGFSRTGAVVTDANGLDPRSVPGLTHVTSLALGPDGRTVWAASYDGTIASFSPDDPSLTPTTYSTGSVGCPYDLAVAGDGRVYFSGGCDAANQSVSVFDPTTSTVTPVTTGGLAGPLSFPVRLANATAAPNVLAVLSGGSQLDIEDVSGAAPAQTGSVSGLQSGALGVSPDGATIVVSTGEFSVQRYDREGDKLGTEGPGTPWTANGLAFSPDDHYLAESSYGQFQTFGPDEVRPLRTYTPEDYNVTLGSSVAWVGQTLVTMTTDVSESQVYLHLHPDAAIAPSTLTATGPATVAIGHPFTLTGHLSDRGTAIGNTTVSITRTDGQGTVSAGTASVGPLGNYTAHLLVPNGAGTTWRVSWAGAPNHAATTASFYRFVTRYSTYLTLRTDHAGYTWGGYVHLTAHLGATFSNRHVTIWQQPAGLAARQVAYASVGPEGNLFRTVRVYRNVRMWVTFSGDLRHAPARTTISRPVLARLSMSLGSWYGTSGSYRLYHSGADPHLHGHVTPAKSGQCGYFFLETYQNGTWQALGRSQCFRLDGASNIDAYFTGPRAVGQRFRVLSVWFGDSLNDGAVSPWSYFEFRS